MADPTESAEALALAARRNDVDELRLLIQGGVSPDAKDGSGYTPLMHAAARGHPESVTFLLEAGADPLILDRQAGASALHRAAQGHSPEAAQALIRHGAPLDLQGPLNGHTPLIDAVWHKRPTIVAVLLAEGARLDLTGRLGYTALDVARRDGLDEIAALLEQRAAEIERQGEEQALMAAVLNGDADGVQRALERGDDVNELSPGGLTPLMAAAQDGDAVLVKLLVAAGADARILDPLMRATPGHKAGYRGHADAARALLESNLELDAQGPYNGYTALHDAVWHGHIETARVLVEGGARLDLEGLDGRTPLQMALEYGYDDLAELLRSAEADRQGAEVRSDE